MKALLFDDSALNFDKYMDSVKVRIKPKFGVEPSTSANYVNFELPYYCKLFYSCTNNGLASTLIVGTCCGVTLN